MNDDRIPASLEQQIEAVRRGALDLDAWRLDEHLACATARRDVAAAHGKSAAAEVWNDVAIEFADIRRARYEVAREIDDFTSPVRILRALTPDELDDEQESQEVPD